MAFEGAPAVTRIFAQHMPAANFYHRRSGSCCGLEPNVAGVRPWIPEIEPGRLVHERLMVKGLLPADLRMGMRCFQE